jgi:hypothetical protein
MKKTLEVLNQLVEGGTLETYAIGGAVAAVFYAEPLLTFDLDVFVLLANEGQSLQPLAPVYAVLKDKGYLEAAECVMIEGVPVRFLPAYNDLILEALHEARQTIYEGVSTRVLRVEHLIAICIQTGREKDRERVRLLREVSEIDHEYLESILNRYKLERNWLP